MEKSGLVVRSYLGEDQRDDPKEICARKTYLETCGGVVPRLQSPLSFFTARPSPWRDVVVVE